MLMSDLTHRSLACKAHLKMLIENALYKFITMTITNNKKYNKPLKYWHKSSGHGMGDDRTTRPASGLKRKPCSGARRREQDVTGDDWERVNARMTLGYQRNTAALVTYNVIGSPPYPKAKDKKLLTTPNNNSLRELLH